MKAQSILIKSIPFSVFLMASLFPVVPVDLGARDGSERKRSEIRGEERWSRPFDTERFLLRFLRKQIDRDERTSWRDGRDRDRNRGDRRWQDGRDRHDDRDRHEGRDRDRDNRNWSDDGDSDRRGDSARGDQGDDGSNPGYVKSPRSSWDAWHDLQPGTSVPRLHIKGEVTVSAGNYEPKLRRRISTANSLQYNVVLRKTGDFGTQVLTTRKIDFSRRYRGNHDEVTIHLPDGDEYVLPIEKVR